MRTGGTCSRTLLALLLVITVVSCGDDDDDVRGLDAIEPPTFEPEPDTEGVSETTSTSTGPETSLTTDRPASTSSPSPSTPSTSSSAPGPVVTTERVSFDDPVGDATPGVGLTDPPEWTDLAGAELVRTGEEYRLHIRLAGTAPDKSSGSNTMNIASFYDVDGDGTIDHEIWVNIDPEGYGPAWYDDRGRAAFGRESGVSVSTAGETVTLSFSASRIGSPDRLRFSLASEYGDVSTIGSSFARRDDAPDDDRAVSFPA